MLTDSAPKKYPAIEEKRTLTESLTLVISAKFFKNEIFSECVWITYLSLFKPQIYSYSISFTI